MPFVFDDFNEPQESFDEPFREDFEIFFEPDPIPFLGDFLPRHEDPLHQEDILVEQFVLQETLFVEDFREPEIILVIETIDQLDDWFEEERGNRDDNREERFVEGDERQEEFLEEVFEEEIVEEVFEELEEVFEQLREEILAEVDAENDESIEEIIEEIDLIENDSPTSNKKLRNVALQVIKNALHTATNSSNVGNVTQGNQSNNFLVTNTSASGSTSSGGISTSSSPSISDQIASANAQNNQVLSMSSDGGGVSMSITPMNTVDGNTDLVMTDVQVQNVQGEIDTAISGVMTSSEADQIADQIIAQNIEQQQEQLEQEQQNTGEYGDESNLVSLIGYVPQFDTYTQYKIPDNQTWYVSQDIYVSATLNDNINAFYDYAGKNINNLQSMIAEQPEIWR
jgi:hypothetical protein